MQRLHDLAVGRADAVLELQYVTFAFQRVRRIDNDLAGEVAEVARHGAGYHAGNGKHDDVGFRRGFVGKGGGQRRMGYGNAFR